MFVKVLSRKNPNYRQLVEYILKDRTPSKSAKDILKHNIKGSTIDAIVKAFERNESLRTFNRKDQIALFHEIISLSSNEENYIPDSTMLDLTRKYIELRGYQGVYFAALHRDTEHCHAHIMTSALEYMTGKAHRISKSALQDIKLILQDYHLYKYPEISESFCDHSKGRTYAKNKEYQRRHKEERTKLKETVQLQVQDLFKQSKTFDKFLTSLRDNGLHYYERGGLPTGLLVGETKIRFSRLGIAKAEIEQLKQPEIKQEEKYRPNTEPIKNMNMKETDINRPQNTEDINYNIPFDEFDNQFEQLRENSISLTDYDWNLEIEIFNEDKKGPYEFSVNNNDMELDLDL